jgi:LacI family transcriptional regulator
VLIAPFIDAEVVEELASKIPTVTVALHGPSRNFDTVVDDEQLGTRLMVEHLASAGHRRIVHTSMPSQPWEGAFQLSHTARRHGFEAAMRRLGLEPSVIETYYSEEGGYEAAQLALSAAEPPTAIFAGADIAAFGVLRAAQELDIKVPKELTVVGYDNIAASSIARVALTTIDQSGHETGEASVRLLLERLEGRTEPRRYVVKPRLIRRRTSRAPANR